MQRTTKRALPLPLLMLLTSLAVTPMASAADGAPRLHPKSRAAVELTFPEPTSVQEIYRALGAASGVTVLFDPGFRDRDIRINLPNVGLEEALSLLNQASGSFHKVLNETSILVAADTPKDRREHEDLMMRTFFLENADIKMLMTSLRSLVDAKKIATNQEQRTLTVRDTAAKVAVMARLVEILDRSPEETQVDVMVLAVPPTLLKGLKSDSEGVRLSTADLEGLRAAGGVTVLAEPSLSILADGRGLLSLTDAVPVRIPEGDRAGDDRAGYSYVDVGLNLKLRTRVHPATREVSLEADLEMESLLPAPGDAMPTRRHRQFEAGLRLGEGQSYLITGLLEASPGSPGLFGDPRTKKGQQVVVALTPRILREPGLTAEDLEGLWVGTETRIASPGRLEAEDGSGPFAGDPESREAVQRLLRERLARLPRGLQGAEEEGDKNTTDSQPPGR